MKKDHLKNKKVVHFRNRKLFRAIGATPISPSTSKALNKLEELTSKQK